MAVQLSDPSISINGDTINIVPNSVEFDEGFGEQELMVQSAGNGILSTVYSNNVETNIGMIKFEMRSTVDNLNFIRSIKANLNQNVVVLTGITHDGKNLTRTYTEAALTNNYTGKLSSDGTIPVEMKGNAPTI
jgi:hypothetical protein